MYSTPQKFSASQMKLQAVQMKFKAEQMKFKETTGCPDPPVPNKDQLKSATAEMMKSMNLQSCKTDNEHMHADVEVSTAFGAGASASFDVNRTSTIGCEQINVLANQYYQTTQNVACVLNKSSSSSSAAVKNTNSITIKAGVGCIQTAGNKCPSLKMSCNVAQKMAVKQISQIDMTEDQANSVANAVKSFSNQVAKVTTDATTGLGATPQGSKAASEMQTKIDNSDYNAQIKDSVKSISSTMDNQNNLVIDSSGDMELFGDQCKFDQDMIVDLAASTTMKDALKTTVSSSMESINQQDQELKAKAVSTGVEATVGFKGLIRDPSKNMPLYIGIGVVILIIIYALYSAFKSPAVTANLNALSSMAGGGGGMGGMPGGGMPANLPPGIANLASKFGGGKFGK